MKDILVDKKELLTKVRENREAHRAIFLEAQEGFKAEVISQLESSLEKARSGRGFPPQYMRFDAPIAQTKDYDRVIAMLEMSKDEEIFITEAQFASYVLDDWSWKDQFLVSNRKYSSTAEMMAAAKNL